MRIHVKEYLLDMTWYSGADTVIINDEAYAPEAIENMIKALQHMVDTVKSDQFDRDYDAAQARTKDLLNDRDLPF